MVDSGEGCIDRFMEEKNLGNKIHPMLLDYKMDGMLGDSVTRTIKQYNGTKIILISIYKLDNEFVKELEENECIVKYIENPIHVADLIEIVASTIS